MNTKNGFDRTGLRFDPEIFSVGQRLNTENRRGTQMPFSVVRWNLQRGTVPIPKANQGRHLREDIDVFDFDISEKEMVALSSLNERYSSLGTPHTREAAVQDRRRVWPFRRPTYSVARLATCVRDHPSG